MGEEERPRLQAATPQSPPKRSPWPDRARAVADWVAAALRQPRTRLGVIGVGSLLLGGLVVTSSVWTLPLLIGGAAMLLIAWIGSRLDGRFAVQWGETGTQVEFRAEIKAARADQPVTTPVTTPAPALATPAAFEPDDADVVEGEAHTVEIDVAELKALIAAAEADEARIRSRIDLAQGRLTHTQRPAA